DEYTLPLPPQTPNDELAGQTLTQNQPGVPVTVQMIAAFLPDGSPTASIGVYSPSAGWEAQLFSVVKGSNQTVDPTINGYTRFFTDGKPFGLFVNWPKYGQSSYPQ